MNRITLPVISVLFAFGQSPAAYGYSLADVQALERKQDWNGLLRYGQAWANAEPNEPNAWAAVSVVCAPLAN